MLDILINAQNLFDGDNQVGPTSIGIKGDRFTWIGAKEDAPEASEVIDTAGTALPGLFDLHFHQFLLLKEPVGGERDVSLDLPPMIAAKVFQAGWAATTWVRTGVTTVRDAGAPDFLAVAMKEAIAAGWVPGPRVFASGPIIAQHGGIRLGNEDHVEEVTGEVEARKTARIQLKKGVDVLKIYGASSIGGGGGRLIGPPGWPQLSEPEMRAIVEEGHKAGRLASAHAVSAESIKNAIRAGVDWVDHADILDDEAIELLLEHDTPIVPTQGIAWSLANFGIEMGFGKHIQEKGKQMAEIAQEGLQRAWKAGVRMAAGTDADNPRASIAQECILFTEIGMDPIDALRAATSEAAKALHQEEDLGRVALGKVADLVLVDGNPVERIGDLTSVTTVIKAGQVVPLAG